MKTDFPDSLFKGKYHLTNGPKVVQTPSESAVKVNPIKKPKILPLYATRWGPTQSYLKLSLMKTLSVAVFFAVSILVSSAQTLEKNLGQFNKVIASPRINLVLMAGETESVKVTYARVDASKINITLRNKTLRIYLDGSRFTEKQRRVNKDGWVEKQSLYRDASITAYVTYRKINKLVVRGEQEVDVPGAIETKKFKLSAYGECDITLASLQTGKFKVSMYGQHTLRIKSGEIGRASCR